MFHLRYFTVFVYLFKLCNFQVSEINGALAILWVTEVKEAKSVMFLKYFLFFSLFLSDEIMDKEGWNYSFFVFRLRGNEKDPGFGLTLLANSLSYQFVIKDT